jgi:TrmH family RNA methyltransferase
MSAKNTRRLANRKFRAQTGEFLAEGPQAVREALAVPGAVLEVFATGKYDEWRLRHDDVVWNTVTDDRIAEIADALTPQGIVARCVSVIQPLASLPAELRLVAIGVDVRDPGNAGSIIRAADAAGADAVIFAGDGVDPLNPKSVRATVGSLFHLPVVVERDLTVAIDAMRQRQLRVLAADGEAPASLFDLDLTGPTAWLFGNEAHGLATTAAALADEVVSIPIYGRAESLNLATAAAVCLYTTARAQRG